MKRISIAIVISLILHLSQYSLVSYLPGPRSYQNDSQTETTVEIVENLETPRPVQSRPIIKTIDNKIDAKTKADFFAEEKNRTKTQTRAQESGQFRSGIKQKTQSDFDLNQAQFNQQLNQSSRSEYKLPNDIQTGSAVNLNTDAHIYASFYNRVTDLFYIRWSQKLDLIWSRLSDQTKMNLSGQNWTTDVEIILDSEGHFVKGLVMKKAGFSPFDMAAIFGFKDAAFFPNPPKAKVEADGSIRLKYRINIQVR